MNLKHPQEKAIRALTTSVNNKRDEMIIDALDEVSSSQIDSSSHDPKDSWSVDPAEKLEYYKRKLQETKKKHRVKCREMRTEMEILKRALADSKESYVSEILVLQKKVSCLNDELRLVKASSLPSSGRENRCGEQQVVAIDRDERIGRSLTMESQLSNITRKQGVTKDLLQIDIVQAQDSLSPPRPTITNNHHNQGSDDEKQGTSVIDLQKINESLVKELEYTKKKCEEYRVSMINEKERSAKEIEAFGEALKGVDDLRQASEDMSREIARLKRRGSDNIKVHKGDVDSISIGSKIEKAKKVIDIHVPLPRERIAWCKVTKHFKRIDPLQMGK